MKMIGNEVYIQRGETWSLDFDVTNDKGHPLQLLKSWQNPYLVITISAALYEQSGDYRESYWLDLNQRWVEKSDGLVELETTKKFITTEALYVNEFTVEDILKKYGVNKGGKIVCDITSDFDVTNFLFFTDPNADGEYVYKYITRYTGDGTDAEWETYSFRVIKSFDTKSLMEQGYFFDAKILTGESLEELIKNTLTVEGKKYKTDSWSDNDTQRYIDMITDEKIKIEAQYLFDEGIPIRSNYDTKSIIIEPTRLYVSVNIQGGVG